LAIPESKQDIAIQKSKLLPALIYLIIQHHMVDSLRYFSPIWIRQYNPSPRMSEAASFAQIVLAKEMIVTVKYRVVTNDMTSVCVLSKPLSFR
jgi:hypothetical protein